MARWNEKHVWDKHAEEHEALTPYDTIDFEDGVIGELNKNTTIKKMIDVGCGSGLWRPVFKDYDYVGFDQNDNMIKVAKKRDFKGIDKTTRFICATAEELVKKSKNVKVDLLFTSAVLQHNDHENKEKFVKEISKVLKKSGYFLFTETTFTEGNFPKEAGDSYSEDMTDGYSFTQSGWISFMDKCGFDVVTTGPVNWYLFKKR